MKRGIGGAMLAVLFVAGLLVAGSVMFVVIQSVSDGDGFLGGGDDGEITIAGTVPFGKLYTEYDAENRHQSAQDDQDDYNGDVYKTEGSCLDDLKDESYVDCSSATPIVWDGKSASIDVPNSALCVINSFKFWQTFTNGDTETSFQADTACELVGAGSIGDAEADDQGTWSAGALNYSVVLEPDTQYLWSITDDSEDDDVYPFVFLMKTPLEVDKSFEDKIDTTSLVLRLNVKVTAEAFANSRVDFGGDCTDSTGRTTTLTRNSTTMYGMVHSGHTTTATDANIDCTLWMEVNKDGYGMFFDNPLAENNLEKSYAKIDPYHVYYNGTYPANERWIEVGADNVSYSAGTPGVVAKGYTKWASLTFDGAVITSDSTVDSLDKGLENLRAQDLKSGTFLGRTYIDDGARAEFTMVMTNMDIDYDNTLNASTDILEAGSGSGGQAVADINIITTLAATDRWARIVGA